MMKLIKKGVTTMDQFLFSKTKLGAIELKNHMVMSPMT